MSIKQAVAGVCVICRKAPKDVREVTSDAVLAALIVALTFAVDTVAESLHVAEKTHYVIRLSLVFMAALYTLRIAFSLGEAALEKYRELPLWWKQGESETAEALTAKPMSVLVVDDDCLVGRSMSEVLGHDPRIGEVDFVDDLQKAFERLKDPGCAPDVVLLDVHFQGSRRSGLDAIGRIRRLAPAAKVMIMSISRERATLVSALKRGADGFIWKNEPNQDIVEAVVDVGHSNFVMSRSIAPSILQDAKQA